jgi:hypothetical protein
MHYVEHLCIKWNKVRHSCAVPWSYSPSLNCLLKYFLVGLQFGIQGFALTKQVLYCLDQTSCPFCSGYFGDRVLWTICRGWPWTMILPMLASQVGRITGVSHQCSAHLIFFFSFCFCIGIWIQCFVFERQVLYHLSRTSSSQLPFLRDSLISVHFRQLKNALEPNSGYFWGYEVERRGSTVFLLSCLRVFFFFYSVPAVDPENDVVVTEYRTLFLLRACLKEMFPAQIQSLALPRDGHREVACPVIYLLGSCLPSSWFLLWWMWKDVPLYLRSVCHLLVGVQESKEGLLMVEGPQSKVEATWVCWQRFVFRKVVCCLLSIY